MEPTSESPGSWGSPCLPTYPRVHSRWPQPATAGYDGRCFLCGAVPTGVSSGGEPAAQNGEVHSDRTSGHPAALSPRPPIRGFSDPPGPPSPPPNPCSEVPSRFMAAAGPTASSPLADELGTRPDKAAQGKGPPRALLSEARSPGSLAWEESRSGAVGQTLRSPRCFRPVSPNPPGS